MQVLGLFCNASAKSAHFVVTWQAEEVYHKLWKNISHLGDVRETLAPISSKKVNVHSGGDLVPLLFGPFLSATILFSFQV
jgi:hypothetical protein